MKKLKSTWISYSEISLFDKIKVIVSNACNESGCNNSYDSAFSFKGSTQYHLSTGSKEYPNANYEVFFGGYVPAHYTAYSINPSQRPALYLIKRTPNRFHLFILTCVMMQYEIQRTPSIKGYFYSI